VDGFGGVGKGRPNLPRLLSRVNPRCWIPLSWRIFSITFRAAEQPYNSQESQLPGMPDRLRVLFITEDDPLYVIQLFEVFFREYSPETLDICGVTIDRPFHEPPWKTLRRMQGLYGTVGVMRIGSRFLRAKMSRRSIASLAAGRSIPMFPATSVNAPEYLETVRGLSPDVIVSVAAPEIFRKEILRIPRLGCINIHSGRLPLYRGMMPTFWQMLQGESAAAVTVHEMAEKLDAGSILGTVTVPLRARDSLDRVITVTKQEGARLLIEVLEKLRLGQTAPIPLNMDGAKYFSFPKREHVREFQKRGHTLL
jgi:methionyl-tRNA formyltransferase